MTAVMTIVRLRWALTLAAVRKSSGQLVGCLIGLISAVGAVCGVAYAGWLLGQGPDAVPQGLLALIGPEGAGLSAAVAYAEVFRVAVILSGAFLTLVVLIMQVVYLGQGSALSPHKFTLYGIPDRQLSLGLLIAGLTGVPSLTGVLCVALWALAYRWMGVVPVLVGVASSPLAIVVIMSLSKLAIAASTSLVCSNRGRNAFYAVAVIVCVVIFQVPNLLVNSGMGIDFGALGVAADVLGWTPLSAPFCLPFDAAAGEWLAFVGHCAVCAATVALCFMGTTWCLRHDRLTEGASRGGRRTMGLGLFGWVPDSPSGAVSARFASYLRRDPRQGMLFAMPIIFVALMMLQARGLAIMPWAGLTMGVWFMTMGEANGLAYDGRGYAMEVIAGVPGAADRLGRVRTLVVLIVGYVVALAVIIAAVTVRWTPQMDDAPLMPMPLLAAGFTGGALGLGFAGIGLAEVLSVLLMYPVPSIDRPFSTPQGRAVAQVFFPLVQAFGIVVLMLPTVVAGVLIGVLAPSPAWLWLLGPIALANGAAVLALGTWLGGKLLDARSLNVLATLDQFASLQ